MLVFALYVKIANIVLCILVPGAVVKPSNLKSKLTKPCYKCAVHKKDVANQHKCSQI